MNRLGTVGLLTIGHTGSNSAVTPRRRAALVGVQRSTRRSAELTVGNTAVRSRRIDVSSEGGCNE